MYDPLCGALLFEKLNNSRILFQNSLTFIANRHLKSKQPAEGVPFYKISKILEKGTPQSCMEVV
jgi:hypothetical protein